MVVTQGFLDAMGIQQLTEPVTITSFSPVQTSFTIVGVLRRRTSPSSAAAATPSGTRACRAPSP